MRIDRMFQNHEFFVFCENLAKKFILKIDVRSKQPLCRSTDHILIFQIKYVGKKKWVTIQKIKSKADD